MPPWYKAWPWLWTVAKNLLGDRHRPEVVDASARRRLGMATVSYDAQAIDELIDCIGAQELRAAWAASLSLAASKVGWLTGAPAPPEYATTNREGGICYLVDEPWKAANAGDGGTCASAKQAVVPASAGLLGGSANVWVLAGRVADERA